MKFWTGLLVAGGMTIAGTVQADLVITEAMSNSSHPGGSANGDWWELTNTGDTEVDLEGYYWDDDGPSGNDGALFPTFTIAAGESIVIAEEADGAAFAAAWGGTFRVLVEGDFGGPDAFSGLSSNGDQIELWDSDPNAGPANLIDAVTFDVSTDGFSFEWLNDGTSAGLSVAGENGAYTAFSNGASDPLDLGLGTDVASPGVVPEPASLALVALGGVLMAGRRRK